MDKNQFISEKISILIKEGYPSDQAAAIAYSMWNQKPKAQEGGMTQANPWDMPNYGQLFQNQMMSPQQNFVQPNVQNYLTPPQQNNYYQGNQPLFSLQQQNLPPTAQAQQGVSLDPNDTSMQGYIPDAEMQRRMAQNQAYNTATNNYDENGNAIDTRERKPDYYSQTQMFNPYGGYDTNTALFASGQGFAQGNNLQGVAGAGLALLGGARNFLSGFASSKANEEQMKSAKNIQFAKNTQPIYLGQEGGLIKTGDKENNAFNFNYNGQNLHIDLPTFRERQRAIQSLQSAEVVQQNQNIEATPLNYIPQAQIPKSFDLNYSAQRIGGTGYYDQNNQEGVDIQTALRAMEQAELQNKYYQEKYGNSDNPKAIERLKQMQDQVILKPNYQEGGITNADMLTGAYLGQQPNGNVEIEVDEHVKNSETGIIQKAVGEKHEDGGVEVNLPDQSKILSNYTKIGAKNAKELKEKYDIKVKATDTFAKVMDRINKKIGWNDLLEEEKELMKKVEKQEDVETNKTTKELNETFLSNGIQDINKQKEDLQVVQNEAFEHIFNQQEKIPKKGDGKTILDEEGKPIAQEGGEVNQMAQQITQALQQGTNPNEVIEQLIKNGIPHEEAMQMVQTIMQQMQGAQQVPQKEAQPIMQEGGRIGSKYENPELYKKQSRTGEGWESFGELLKDKPKDVLSEIKRVHPELYLKFFKDDKINKDNIAEFQLAVNKKYNTIVDNAKTLYGADSPQAQNIIKQVNNDKFTDITVDYSPTADGNVNTNVRGLDAMLGNYTATRPNFQLEVLPTAELEKVKKAGVNTSSQLATQFPDLYKTYVADKGLKEADFWLGDIKSPTAPKDETAPVAVDNTPLAGRDLGTQFIAPPALPQSFVLPPSSLADLYKGEVRFGELDPTKITPEANLVEMERQRQSASNQAYFLPDAQRAAVLSSLLGQSQAGANEAIGKAEMFNAQQQQQADQYNLQTQAKEDLTNINLNQDFERRNLGGQAAYESNLRSYFNNLNSLNRQNFADVRDMNLMNQFSNNYDYTGAFRNPTQFNAKDAELMRLNKLYQEATTPEQKNALQAQQIKLMNS